MSLCLLDAKLRHSTCTRCVCKDAHCLALNELFVLQMTLAMLQAAADDDVTTVRQLLLRGVDVNSKGKLDFLYCFELQ